MGEMHTPFSATTENLGPSGNILPNRIYTSFSQASYIKVQLLSEVSWEFTRVQHIHRALKMSQPISTSDTCWLVFLQSPQYTYS